MVAPRPPRARLAVGIAAVPALALVALYADGAVADRTVVVSGLVLDVFGAALLAVPDVPGVRGKLYSGNLEAARRRLGEGWGFSNLAASELPDEHVLAGAERRGFAEAVDVLADHADGPDARWTDAVFLTVQSGGGSVPAAGRWLVGTDEENEQVGVLHFERFADLAEAETAELDARLRRSGLAILALGFLLQAVPYVW